MLTMMWVHKLRHAKSPVSKEDLAEAVKAGMIPRCNLENGAYYVGYCRNALIAQWDERAGRFVYLRHKFGTIFSETINHPENDDGFDFFVPVRMVDLNLD